MLYASSDLGPVSFCHFLVYNVVVELVYVYVRRLTCRVVRMFNWRRGKLSRRCPPDMLRTFGSKWNTSWCLCSSASSLRNSTAASDSLKAVSPSHTRILRLNHVMVHTKFALNWVLFEATSRHSKRKTSIWPVWEQSNLKDIRGSCGPFSL